MQASFADCAAFAVRKNTIGDASEERRQSGYYRIVCLALLLDRIRNQASFLLRTQYARMAGEIVDRRRQHQFRNRRQSFAGRLFLRRADLDDEMAARQ